MALELYKEILAKVFQEQEINIVFPGLQINTSEIVELRCYQAFQSLTA